MLLSLSAALIGVASIIDGDTLEIHGQRIRLEGVDAPESRQSCQLNGKPWRCGTASANALADWVGRRTAHCEEQYRDRYKRAVARCSVDGVSMEDWLVRNGWALDYPRYSKGAHANAQQEAQTHRRGIWASEFEAPWEWRRR